MLQPIRSEHYRDRDGHPAGGHTQGTGITISWQDGPLGQGANRRTPTGAFVEGVIEAAADRLRFYQQSDCASLHNNLALMHLDEALRCLQERTRDREERGVEGTYQP